MQYEVKCDCGWSAKGTQGELIPLIQAHGKEVHGMDVTPDQAIAQLKPVDA